MRRTRCPWLGVDRADVGHRVGECHDRRSRQRSATLRIHELGLRLPDAGRGVFSDDLQVRADNKNADIAYFTTRHSFKETWTAQDGRSFTLSGHNLYKDIKAKRVDGTALRVHLPYPWPAGHRHGLVRQGSRAGPRERFILLHGRPLDGAGSDTGFRLSGPHPTFDTDLCLIVEPLVAPLASRDSARYLTQRPIGSTDFRRWATTSTSRRATPQRVPRAH